MKKISGVIMDWAGTAVDYGCFAPLNAFLKVFSEEKGIDITYRQAREPMGLLKIDHIKAILSMPEVNEKFRALYKRDWNKGDVDEMYASFEKHLFASLKDFTTPIPGVLETMAMLREQGIKIGSTTGYTAKMMEIVRPGAEAKGYRVDNLVTPNEVPAGRPAPYMIYKNMIDLAIPSVDQVVKVGDTIADIKEGVNAKVWSVGIVTGSNEMGVSEEEYNSRPAEEWESLKKEVRDDKRLAGQIAGVHRRNGHRAFHADSALSARDVADLRRRVRAERLAHLQAFRQLKFLPEQRIRLSAGDGSAQGNLLRGDFRAARRIHPCEHLQRLCGRAAGIQLHNRAHIQPPALHGGIHMLHPRLCLYATFRLRAQIGRAHV